MTNIFIRNFIGLFILTFIFLFQPIESDDLICNSCECRSVLMGDYLLFIKIDMNDYSINYYDFNQQKIIFLKNYANNIRHLKNILKLNDTSFLVLGVNVDNYFYINIFSINNDINNLEDKGTKYTLLDEENIEDLYVKINSEKLIISMISDNIFKTASYDLSTNTLTKAIIPDSSGFDTFIKTKMSIRCSSLEGEKFFCVYNYYDYSSSQRPNSMFYAYGNYNNNDDIKIRNICSKCVYGNIEVIDSNKYLLCYHDQQSNSYFYTRCKYYSYDDSNNLEEEGDDITFFIPNYKYIDHKPLNIYQSKNSIFISFNYETEDVAITYMIIASLNFKIKSEFKIFTSSSKNPGLSTINILNSENYLYHIYVLGREIAPKTYINRINIISCAPITGNDTISIVNDSVVYNLLEGHDKLNIKFSINDSLHLSPSNQNYDSSINDKTNFTIKRGNDAGVFHNYYMYLNDSNYFSLICPLTITSCYSLCSDCTPNFEANETEQHCKNCISGYSPKNDDPKDSEGSSNCYKQEELIQNYYYDSSSSTFKRCNETCKYCENSYSCLSCNDSYYFKNGEVMANICYTGKLDYYYLSTNENIEGFKETIDTVYKKCYQTCQTCLGEGNQNDHNCEKCKNYLTNYNFDKRQCMINYNTECFDKEEYWEFKDNNITCKSENYCKNKKIILYGQNKGQCVDDCNNFEDPNNLNQYFYTLLNCEGKSYCIPSEMCLKKKFDKVNHEEKTCERKAGYLCQNIDFFHDPDPFSHDDDPEGTTEPLTPDEKMDEISKRIKVVKILTDERDYLNYNNNDTSLINEYKDLFQKESENYEKIGIYLIILKKYYNFNITIYPMDIETFTNDKVLSPNNLCSINFQGYFSDYIGYEINNNQIILVILLERFSLNSSINDINYYFYGMNEDDDEQSKFLNSTYQSYMRGNSNN